MIGLVVTTAAGRRAAERLTAVLPDTRSYDVRELAFDAGFEFEDITSNWWRYTANFRRRR